MMGINQDNDDVPPGLRAWMFDAEADGPFYGVDRTQPSIRFNAPPEPPRSVWARLRDAWAGMVAGWKGEVE